MILISFGLDVPVKIEVSLIVFQSFLSWLLQDIGLSSTIPYVKPLHIQYIKLTLVVANLIADMQSNAIVYSNVPHSSIKVYYVFKSNPVH